MAKGQWRILVILAELLLLFSITSGFNIISISKTPAREAYSFSRIMMSNDETSSSLPDKKPIKPRCPDCDKCDGSGRILGGIPIILPWWPIKPYRPCPNLVAAGTPYVRQGSSLDEIAFGNASYDDPDDDLY